MKRFHICALMAIGIALAAPAAVRADDVKPIVKRPSDKPGTRTAAKPDPKKIEKKPNAVVSTRVAPEKCDSAEEAMIESARAAAAVRTQVAVDKARGLHPSTGANDKREAERLFEKLVAPDVDFDQVVEVSESIRNKVSSPSLAVQCETDKNPNCAVRTAYVENLSAPIHFCPAFFQTSTREQRVRTLVHESAHLSRIKEDGDSESYCVSFDCDTNCGGFGVADGWAHFLHCLSGEKADEVEVIEGN